jgi:nitrogen fixation protein FixH
MSANVTMFRRPLTGRTVLICLIAFFAVVAAVNGIMIRAAISTFGGVETGSAYQAGQAFKQETDAARAQEGQHWQVKASLRPAAGKTVIDIEARDSAGRPLTGLAATAHLHHPANRRADQIMTVSEGLPGHFSGTTDPLVGQWDVLIELSRDGERVFRSRNRIVLQ